MTPNGEARIRTWINNKDQRITIESARITAKRVSIGKAIELFRFDRITGKRLDKWWPGRKTRELLGYRFSYNFSGNTDWTTITQPKED